MFSIFGTLLNTAYHLQIYIIISGYLWRNPAFYFMVTCLFHRHITINPIQWIHRIRWKHHGKTRLFWKQSCTWCDNESKSESDHNFYRLFYWWHGIHFCFIWIGTKINKGRRYSSYRKCVASLSWGYALSVGIQHSLHWFSCEHIFLFFTFYA